MTPDEKRAANRARFPELAAIMDDLGADSKMVCIRDDAGNVLAGKPPAADPASWVTISGDCFVALANFGRTK
jgi:hypothetical protein